MAIVLRKLSVRLVPALCVLALLVVLPSSAQAYPEGDDVLKFLPEDSQFVVSVKVASFLKSGVWTEMRQEVKDLNDLAKSFKDSTGLTPDEVDQLVLSGRRGEIFMVVRTNKAINGPDLAASIKGSTFKETKVGRFTIYENQKDADESFAVFDNKTLLVGRAAQLKTVLMRDRTPRFSAAMRTALAQTDFTQTLAFAADVKVFADGKTQAGPLDAFTEPVIALAGSARAGDDLTVKLTILCKDAEAAEDGRKLLDGVLVFVKYAYKNDKDVPKEVIDLVRRVKVTTDGNSIHATATIPAAALAKATRSFMNKK
jgi:hypothetical protein